MDAYAQRMGLAAKQVTLRDEQGRPLASDGFYAQRDPRLPSPQLGLPLQFS